jgi:hypothetical protein
VPAGRPVELALTKRELDDPDLVNQIKAIYEDEECGWTCDLVGSCLVLT